MYLINLLLVAVSFSVWIGGRMLAGSIANIIQRNLYKDEEAKARLMTTYKKLLTASYVSFGVFFSLLLADYLFV